MKLAFFEKTLQFLRAHLERFHGAEGFHGLVRDFLLGGVGFGDRAQSAYAGPGSGFLRRHRGRAEQQVFKGVVRLGRLSRLGGQCPGSHGLSFISGRCPDLCGFSCPGVDRGRAFNGLRLPFPDFRLGRRRGTPRRFGACGGLGPGRRSAAS